MRQVKGFLRFMFKAVGAILVVLLLFIGSLFFREQQLPRCLVDVLERRASGGSALVRVDSASFGFRRGVRLRDVRVYDMGRPDSLENPVGEARLVLLENAEDPLECGIDIIARPPGKRPQSVTLLSGGERTMTAVALLFSIFMIKPAPFCMLDELDAALDDANIGRFVDQLKEFLVNSQFLIITHNQHTIAGSDLVYGVSQQEKGVSRVISMKLSDLGVRDGKKK